MLFCILACCAYITRSVTHWNYLNTFETDGAVHQIHCSLLIQSVVNFYWTIAPKINLTRRESLASNGSGGASSFFNRTIYHVAEKFGADELWREFAFLGMICLCRGMLSHAQKFGMGAFCKWSWVSAPGVWEVEMLVTGSLNEDKAVTHTKLYEFKGVGTHISISN